MKAIAVVFLLSIIGIGANPVGVCPSTHGTSGVDFLLHDSDPTKFYYCVWGTPVLFTCPAGLHFNLSLGVCDWPGGSATVPPIDPPTTPGTGTTEPSVPAPTAGPGACAPLQSLCPNPPGPIPEFFPHPTDPNRYCKCDFDRIHDMPCAPGLEFNPSLNVCDWPGGTPPVTSPPVTSPPVTVPPVTVPPVTTPPVTTPPVTVPPTTAPTGCPTSPCPFTPGTYPVFFAHPTNPNRYCKCDNFATVHDMPCPEGLVFNTTLNVCDWR